MRKWFLFVLFALFAQHSRSQILISLIFGDKLNSDKLEFGMDGGVNWSMIRGLEQQKRMPTFNLGFYFDIKLPGRGWMIATGVFVKSSMGAQETPLYKLGDPALDTSFIGGSVTKKISYFNLPIQLKYAFKKGLFVKGGVMLGLRHNGYDIFKKEEEDNNLEYTVKTSDTYNRIDAGIAVGAGYKFPSLDGMRIGVQYYYGFAAITKNGPAKYNESFYLTIGIPVGKEKSPKIP